MLRINLARGMVIPKDPSPFTPVYALVEAVTCGLYKPYVDVPWPHRRFLCEGYLSHQLVVLEEYLLACEFQGLAPLRCTVSLLARKLREYRIANKFYDVV